MLKSSDKLRILFFIALWTFTLINCNGHETDKKFDKFLSHFIDFDFPIVADDFLGHMVNNYIIEKDFLMYDSYLRDKNDTLWAFHDDYDFAYGGKHKLDNYWLVFFRRGIMPEMVSLQKSQIVFVTYTLDGKIISLQPISGYYGESIIIETIINSSDEIIANYTDTDYEAENGPVETRYSMHYYIDNNGTIVENKKESVK